MTLLICVFAAIVATVKWYKDAPEGSMKLGILCWMYWGASIMCCFIRVYPITAYPLSIILHIFFHAMTKENE